MRAQDEEPSFLLCQGMGNQGTGQLTWGVFDCGAAGAFCLERHTGVSTSLMIPLCPGHRGYTLNWGQGMERVPWDNHSQD